VHRVYRECAGGSWDDPVDVSAVMRDVSELKRCVLAARDG